MSTYYIHEKTPSLDALLNQRGVHYLQDQNMAVSISWDCWDAKVRIWDLRDAMKPGSTCVQFTMVFPNAVHNDDVGFRWMSLFLVSRSSGDCSDFRKIHAELLSCAWSTGRFGGYEGISLESGANVGRSDRPAVRTFSPFAKVARLPQLPTKWTVRHVVRALLNGQFCDLRCNGKYTDDYAYDAAVNFGKGEISNAVSFARELIESPSGWWAHGTASSVSICCHSFDSNSFTPDIARGLGKTTKMEIKAAAA